MKLRIYGMTDVGRERILNEDGFAICGDLKQKNWLFDCNTRNISESGTLMIVTDGVGGAGYGDIASELTLDSIRCYFENPGKDFGLDLNPEVLLKKAIWEAHRKIVYHARHYHSMKGMACTIVLGWIVNNRLYVSWVGDSRCYLYDGVSKQLLQLTEDHTQVWELVQKGILSTEQARIHPMSNVLSQAIGNEDKPPDPGFKSIPLENYTRILMCTDGLHGMLSDIQIKRILNDNNEISETCSQLIKVANDCGGIDNITCTLCDILS